MNTVDVLVKAKQLIEDPLNWIQGDYTKVVDGRQCFCSLGAVASVMNPDADFEMLDHDWSNHPIERLLNDAVGRHEPTTFAMFNDNKSHAEVMEAFDKAIKLAKQEV